MGLQSWILFGTFLTTFFYSSNLYLIPLSGCILGFLGLVVVKHHFFLKVSHYILAFTLLIGTIVADYLPFFDILYIFLLTNLVLASRILYGRCLYEDFSQCKITILPDLNRNVYNFLFVVLLVYQYQTAKKKFTNI